PFGLSSARGRVTGGRSPGCEPRAKAFPSYVAVTADGQVLVGEAARRQAASPEGTATAFKRTKGQRLEIRLRDRGFTPEQLSTSC
ncbi:MAG: Hsp70 family protein, partial [Acidimicrobiales bacterium]